MDLTGYARLQKDEAPNDPNLFQTPPDPIKSHPLFAGTMPVAFMTGSNPKYPTKIAGQSDSMKAVLDKMGLQYERTKGKYGGPPEDSFIVYNPSREQAFDLGHQFGQESVMYSQNGNHQILFTNGEHAGKYHPALPQVWFHPTTPPEDYFTQVPNQGYLRLHFDWDTMRDAPDKDRLVARMSNPQMQQIAKSLAGLLPTTLKKNEGPLPHPHLYPWHEGHTSHHFVTTGHGVLVHRNHFEQNQPLGKSELDQKLEKAWTPSPDGALPQYGASGVVAAPSYLPLHGKEADVDALLKKYGHSSYYYGGRHGRPDLARRNYDTKHLPIFDPTSGSEGAYQHQSYVNTWRKLHELAHALTHDQINQIYGNGRRRGGLGDRRTTREALRAVHWEHAAMHKQRDLMREMGVEISDQDFNRELNTVMQDAVHRVTTGAEQHPSLHAFTANDHPVPLSASLNLIRQAAHNLGLRGSHDLAIKKSEQGSTPVADKTMTDQEMRKSVADALRAVLAKHEEGMTQLRARELKKSGKMCALCGNPDKPGSCTCVLRKDENGEHKFVAGKGNERQVKTCSKCGKPVSDHMKVMKGELCESCAKGEKTLGKGEGCPVCKSEDKIGLCKCFKKSEILGGNGVQYGQNANSMSMAEKPAKVGGDKGSGGQISSLNKGAMQALKPTSLTPPAAAAPKPAPTPVGQVNAEMGKFQSLAGGNPAPTMAAKLTGAVPPPASMAQAGTKAMAKPAGGPPPVPADAKLPGVLGGLNNRGMKSLLAVPTRKGEPGWTKKGITGDYGNSKGKKGKNTKIGPVQGTGEQRPTEKAEPGFKGKGATGDFKPQSTKGKAKAQSTKVPPVQGHGE